MMSFEELFSIDKLFEAWLRFRRGKTGRHSVIFFERHLESHSIDLHRELLSGCWRHAQYQRFEVFDPKKRGIYAASIRDRVVHQILYDYLEKIYEPIFISDSFASRNGKGVDAAVKRARFFLEDTRKWNRGRCFALRCDIKKYFDSVNQTVLLNCMRSRVQDSRIFDVLADVVGSFRREEGHGIPLGNIVSQIFANIYLHELDLFVQSKLKFPKYVRYNDDTLFVSADAGELRSVATFISRFVAERLFLAIPPEKSSIRKFQHGIHFLGRIIIPGAVLPRMRTIKRILNRISAQNRASYFGLLKNVNAFVARRVAREKLFFDDL